MFKAFPKLLVLCLATASAVMAADTTGQTAFGNVQSQVEAIDESDHVRRLGHHHARSPTATIEGIVLGTRGLETLASLVAAAGLGPDGALSSSDFGDLTLFAPTNRAFKKTFALYPGLQDFLGANIDVLQIVLLYHVYLGRVMARDVPHEGVTIPMLTLGPDGLQVSTDTLTATRRCWWFGWWCYIELQDGSPDKTYVRVADIAATNGVIHAIDKVLVPPSLADAVAGFRAAH